MMPLPIPQTLSKYWAFRNGLDQVSPSISIPPGSCRASTNVEVGANGGLVTTSGYEAFDGRAKPSDAVYHIISATITGTYALGNTLTGATSGATGVIIAATTTSFVITRVVGAYTVGETLNIAAVGVAVATSTNSQSSASTQALNATYKNLAAAEYRTSIAAVPGSGPVLGVWKYNSVRYAFRNNAGGTAAVMYKDTTSGWLAINPGRELSFTAGGVYQVVVGNTITGATSGATAVITKVVLTSGSWGAKTAVGRFYFASQTGTFQAENLNVGANLNVATIAANSAAITLAPSGRYEFINQNFGGLAGATKMYGCSGTHRAFEWDGTVFSFIVTGTTTDTPSHIGAHKKHLFLSFMGSVQHSGIGDPFSWSVVSGAAELAVGADVTNFLGAPGSSTGGALVIYTRISTYVLYGNSAADWNLVPFNPDAGALKSTAQYISQGVALNDRGVTLMSTTQAFGNFANAEISAPVRPYVNSLIETAVASCVVRTKNQYRLFFSGGAALYVTFISGQAGPQVGGLMPISLANPVTCICSLESETGGEEEIFFGSTDGFVYQMDKGTSQNGAAIAWTAELAYNHFGGPRQLKSFVKAVVEVSGSGYASFTMAYNVGYGTADLPQGVASDTVTPLAAAQWDTFTWDRFFWDGQTLLPAEADIDGTAENLSLAFSGSSAEYAPITLNGAIINYKVRRAMR